MKSISTVFLPREMKKYIKSCFHLTCENVYVYYSFKITPSVEIEMQSGVCKLKYKISSVNIEATVWQTVWDKGRLLVDCLRRFSSTRGAGMMQYRVLASHQCGSSSIPGLGVMCGIRLLLVLILAPGGFPRGTPVFLSPQKSTFPNSNSIARGISISC